MAKLKIEGYIGHPESLEILSEQPFFNLEKLDNWLDENKDKDITIEINSGGGSVREGWAMHDRLKTSGRNITTVIIGMCGSIATVLGLSAPKGQRKAHKNAKGFIHNPYVQTLSPIEAKDAKQLEKDLNDEEKRILDFYTSETGSESGKLQKYMNEKAELSADELKTLGFIDEVITTEVAAQKKFHVLAFHEGKEIKNLTDIDKSWIGKKVAGLLKDVKELMANQTTKNMMAKLQDGKEIFVESEDGDWTGKKAFETDKVTALKAGSYNLEDGRVMVVDETGTITEVKAVTANPINAELERVKKELKAANEKLAAIEADKKDEKLAKVEAELLEIKNHYEKVIGKVPGRAKQGFKGQEDEPQDRTSRVKANLEKFSNKVKNI